MNKKAIIIIVAIVVILLTCIIIFKKTNKQQHIETSEEIVNDSDYIVKYSEEYELYYLVNKDNEDLIITASPNKDDLNFFIKHPNYNPSLELENNKMLEDYWIEEQTRLQKLQEEEESQQ